MIYNNHTFMRKMRETFGSDVEKLLSSELWESVESSKLPKDCHEEVFENILYASEQDSYCLKVSDIAGAFIWADTIQGGDYWNNIEDLMEGDYFD